DVARPALAVEPLRALVLRRARALRPHLLGGRRQLAAPARADGGRAAAPALPRLRQALLRLHHAVGVPLLLAVPAHLGGQPAGGDPILPAPHARYLGNRLRPRAARPLR